MAYTKQTWIDNSVANPVSAARMNYIEDGIETVATKADLPLSTHATTHAAGGADPLSIKQTLSVLDVGQVAQTRAGRVLTVADFTALGLSTPVGLFNLTGLTNLGSGGALVNKGSVPFAKGITGSASEAALFAGSTAQALYIVDTGAADPFRIRSGSVGCWFRSAKRGVATSLVTKYRATGDLRSWFLQVGPGNTAGFGGTSLGTFADLKEAVGSSDVCDDRWHFAVGTHDGTKLRLYVDGVLESEATLVGVFHAGASPFNVGALEADAGVASTNPYFGRIDEAFVTPDVLSEDQVRMLYAVKVPHGLATTPTRTSLSVVRRRRGALLATSDFTATPLRLYNLNGATNGAAAADLGSQAVSLSFPGSAVAGVVGPDGATQGAVSVSSTEAVGLNATDAGLPAGATGRSYGVWFAASTPGVSSGIISWGTIGTADARLGIYGTNNASLSGTLWSASGSDTLNGPRVAADGGWHHVVMVEDNTAFDAKRKMYLDGRLIATSAVLNSITLAGANKFRIGAYQDGLSSLRGQVARVFVAGYAMDASEVQALYAKGSQALLASPKNAGDHIEGVDATNLYVLHDTLEPQDSVNLEVSA